MWPICTFQTIFMSFDDKINSDNKTACVLHNVKISGDSMILIDLCYHWLDSLQDNDI